MAGLTRETRLQIMLDENELEKIDTWRFEQRMPSRASAIRRLLQIALEIETKGTADPQQRSTDFGVLSDDDPNNRRRR